MISIMKVNWTKWVLRFACCALSVCLSQARATDIIQTIAGGGSLEGYKPDEANLFLGGSQGLAVNALGELLVSDSTHNQVLKINPTTGLITVVAGNGTGCYFGDGLPAYSAGLHSPGALAFDAQGNLYIADVGNYVIRRVEALSGLISTVAGNGLFTGQVVGPNPAAPLGDGGQATAATFSKTLGGICVDGSGNVIVADSGNACIRRFALGGTINTIAGVPGSAGYSGDGVAGGALAAQFRSPSGVAVGGGDVFIADSGNRRVRRLVSGNTVITVAGDGTGGNGGFGGDGGLATGAQIGSLGGLAFDAAGNLLLSCAGAGRIRRVDVLATGTIVTIAGNGGTVIGDLGPATGASLSSPRDVALDRAGNIFIYDTGNGRVRRVDKATGFIDTVLGTGLKGFIGDRGPNQDGVLANPRGADMDASGNLYIADTADNAVRVVSPDGKITTLAGNGTGPGLGDGGPAYLATLNAPTDVALFGNTLFICENGNGNIRSVNLADANKTISTYAALNNPVAIAVDSAGILYVARSNQIDRVATDGTVTTYVGSSPVNKPANPNGDGLPAANCRLSNPSGLFIAPTGELYIADTGHDLVRLISAPPQSLTSTVAGGGSPAYPSVGDGGPANQALLSGPMGVTLDPAGVRLIISDTGNQRIRAVDFSWGITSSGNISTIAGNGIAGFSGDGDLAVNALVNSPQKIMRSGPALVLADSGNNRIRKLVSAIDIDPRQLAFAAKLSFAIDKKTGQMDNGKDSVALKAALPLPAGISAANLRIFVDIVDLHQQVQLDAKGKLPKPPKAAKAQKVVPLFDFTLPHGELAETSSFSLGLKGTSLAGAKPTTFSFASKGTFREELGRAGFSDVSTPKAGTSLPVRVDITLGTTTFTGLTTVLWKATQAKGGAAQSVKPK
jgi:sugar lactone lactonase YvrE